MKRLTISENKSRKICEEVSQKIKKYEGRMVTRLDRWNAAAELYSGHTSTKRENSKPSPNSAELYKAIRAKSSMLQRMLLGKKPCFELECNDIIGYQEPSKLLKSEHYVTQQMDLARYNKNLGRALDQLLLYGTIAIHNIYEPIRASFLGRKQYVTSYRPMSLFNCAFALDSYDIEESSWVALSDIQSVRELHKLLAHDPKGEIYDRSAINAAISMPDYKPELSTWVTQRLAWQGYTDSFEGAMERVTYYGPLEEMGGEEEYCVEIVNKEHIIRIEPYLGLKPVRICAINTIDCDPMGSGLYDMFGGLLGRIDNIDAALQNMVELAGANMFVKQKSLTDEQTEWQVRNFGIMSLENPVMNPIGPNPANLQAVAGFGVDQVQKFRQASGATDTLQAIVQGEQATATEVSLAMNESVRALSVLAERIAPNLLGDYVRIILQNAQKYQTTPFTLNVAGVPVEVMPADLLIDTNVRIKTLVDQDFRPAKLAREREALMIMGSMPPPPGKKWNPGPVMEDYLKTLDVPHYDQVIQDMTEEDMAQIALMNQLGAEQGAGQVTSGPQSAEGSDTLNTPAGPVLAAPGDQKGTTQAVRASSV